VRRRGRTGIRVSSQETSVTPSNWPCRRFELRRRLTETSGEALCEIRLRRKTCQSASLRQTCARTQEMSRSNQTIFSQIVRGSIACRRAQTVRKMSLAHAESFCDIGNLQSAIPESVLENVQQLGYERPIRRCQWPERNASINGVGAHHRSMRRGGVAEISGERRSFATERRGDRKAECMTNLVTNDASLPALAPQRCQDSVRNSAWDFSSGSC